MRTSAYIQVTGLFHQDGINLDPTDGGVSVVQFDLENIFEGDSFWLKLIFWFVFSFYFYRESWILMGLIWYVTLYPCLFHILTSYLVEFLFERTKFFLVADLLVFFLGWKSTWRISLVI